MPSGLVDVFPEARQPGFVARLTLSMALMAASYRVHMLFDEQLSRAFLSRAMDSMAAFSDLAPCPPSFGGAHDFEGSWIDGFTTGAGAEGVCARPERR